MGRCSWSFIFRALASGRNKQNKDLTSRLKSAAESPSTLNDSLSSGFLAQKGNAQPPIRRSRKRPRLERPNQPTQREGLWQVRLASETGHLQVTALLRVAFLQSQGTAT